MTRQPHKYGPTRHVLANVSPSRREQFERACLNCPLVRITVIGDANPRQYRFGNGAQFVDHAGAPECVPIVDGQENKELRVTYEPNPPGHPEYSGFPVVHCKD